MKKHVLTFSILMVTLILFPQPMPLAYEDTVVVESMQTIEGDITEIDTNLNRITLRWLGDEILMKYQDVLLDVPSTCAITKNGETIRLDDLEQNDPATVRFDGNAQPLPRATTITVTE